ncbi:nucleoside hydrolase [Thiospirochaeta perfilievii]|uniref:Nucleoside hydrolase n=1 Tax=Thiospirochaeta perfilievii TaxID=252967 RepID=A0A5C1QE94_9SPIO|nr:nucleoside hydrolase [Thiospirochaeta perfilievii]QEN05698.1 nucleoside hydrolase [Thiospirochaeta perfilievii]
MRKFIIDTDTGSDDAIALIMALKSKEINIEAITTVCGNITLEQATLNALMTIEVTDTVKPPVFSGSSKPLKRKLETAEGVHGQDGMGGKGLIHPTLKKTGSNAVEKILSIVEENPGEIEIITIGPVTNLAQAILEAPETMKKVKHIYSMATGGFGPGNVTPVAEFNVYVDAEAFDIMLRSDIPITIAGFDICIGDAAFNEDEINFLRSSESSLARFAMDINSQKIEWNIKTYNRYAVNLPDPVAMAVALWDDIVIEKVEAHCHTCIKEEAAYGQVIVDTGKFGNKTEDFNAVVIKSIDADLYKKRLIKLLVD